MKRVRYEAIICCSCEDSTLAKAGQRTLSCLSKRHGGATISKVTGAWAQNGNDFTDSYQDAVVESGIRVSLTVPVADSERAYQDLLSIITGAKNEFNLCARYIHVDRLDSTAMHFDCLTGVSCIETAQPGR